MLLELDRDSEVKVYISDQLDRFNLLCVRSSRSLVGESSCFIIYY